MKRALAERAKHDPNGLAPPGLASSVSSPPPNAQQQQPKEQEEPPLKIPRIITKEENGNKEAEALHAATEVQSQPLEQKQQEILQPLPLRPQGENESTAFSSQSNNASSTNPAPAIPLHSAQASVTPKAAKASMKRQRTAHDEDDDQENENSAFFLKHQNAALASEMRQLRFQFELLEKEREVRRKQCLDANQTLHTLEATWTAIEVALKMALSDGHVHAEQENDEVGETRNQQPPKVLPKDLPRSTGTGDNVELIGALMDSLEAIANDSRFANTSGDDHATGIVPELARHSDKLSKRATALQKWIWGLLRKVTTAPSIEASSDDANAGKNPMLKIAKLEAKLSTYKSQIRDIETKMAELAKCRDDAMSSEKRVRRGLYRLHTGRSKLDEVMQAIESEEDKALMMQEACAGPETTDDTGGDGEDKIDSAQVAQLKKQLRDLEEISGSREKQIDQLTIERQENLKRINELALASNAEKDKISEVIEDDVKRTQIYADTWARMTTAERLLENFKTKMAQVKDRWAESRGDADFATRSLEEHMLKHKKRWADLTDVALDVDVGEDDVVVDREARLQAQRIAELEHKLKQALENIRRAETVRALFDQAKELNVSLQARLEEEKAKNFQEFDGKLPETSREDKKELDAPTDSKTEKLHKEYRRMERHLAAAIASKENAKAKLEKSEKDRDSLMKMNSLLVHQSAEKDEMNAKSLSTILHLKSLTEKLEQEKELLEQQTKSAGQVNVAARLASNARDRVAEEVKSLRTSLESQVKDLEQQLEHAKESQTQALANLTMKEAELKTLLASASTAQGRCDELVAESQKLLEEKKALLESLAVAQREASEATSLVNRMRSAKGGSSLFTVEQLETQVSVLKSRLACPVCNHRDKGCIISRCKHMFCKVCIDENIKNRNRKCPSCGQRFDTKDVEDIWL